MPYGRQPRSDHRLYEALALDHIRRNGSLMWLDVSDSTRARLYDDLQRRGLIEQNPWRNPREPWVLTTPDPAI